MNDTTDSSRDDQDMQTLLQGIDPLPEPSRRAANAAYTSLKSEWQDMVAQRKVRRQRRWLSVAAGLVLAVGAGVVVQNQQPDHWQTRLAAGAVSVQGTGLHTEQDIDTHPALQLQAIDFARLELSNGAQLRLSPDTKLKWLDQGHIELSAGQLYIDTFEQADVRISTPFGEVTDIGTQFMVGVSDEQLEVAVRHGAARWQQNGRQREAHAQNGEVALLAVDAQGASSSTEAADAPRWAWIHEVPSGYTERRVSVLLELIAADLGKSIRYASPGVEAMVANDTVNGDLRNLAPNTALALVAQSAGLVWHAESGVILIDRE